MIRVVRDAARRLVLATLAVASLVGQGCGPRGPAARPDTPPRVVDLVIRGALVVDGTGQPARPGDVAVDGERIAAVGRLEGWRGRREIQAEGLVVAPGFVDLHSHADVILLAPREVQESLLGAKISQGVTTILVGNCGLGVAPATREAAEILGPVNGWMTPQGVSAPPLSVAGYLARLSAAGLALNAGTLVPHGPVRVSAMGLAPGAPDAGQLRRMESDVEEGLAAGAFGLSTGLIYPPGMYSATDELVALARVVARHDRLFTSHVRGSSETLLEATRELIEIGRRSGARVHHSHMEAVGQRFWAQVPAMIAAEDEARARGVDLSHDVFPYTRAATMMSAIFPPWALEGGLDALLARLAEPATRERLRREIAERVPSWPPWNEDGWPHNLVEAVGWDGILVASVGPEGKAADVGRSLSDLARERGRDPFDVVADLMLAERGRVGQLVDEISGRDDEIEPLLTILRHPAAAVISDAEDYGRGRPHPAHAGAFVRALRLARERSLLSLEEIVRRMTAWPASRIGLADRGVLRAGAAADLVVFDPERVADRASWTDPRARAVGVRWVWINGHPVVEEGLYVGSSPGHVLRAS